MLKPGLAFCVVLLAMSSPAWAEVYFSQAQVAEAIFPGEALKPFDAELSPAETKSIQRASGERVLYPKLVLLTGTQKQALFIDKVVGKHSFITYAVGITPEGRVKGVEIMEYLETFGKQVRGEKWRAQFSGKGTEALLKVGKDIDAISGATLSATHVSGGVRRILKTYDVIKSRLP